MQKISSYLYPNRISILADLDGYSVEFTSVYQRNVKLYNGIDNTIEFDIKNADQKRIDLSVLNRLELNIMDASGTALINSPYQLTQVMSPLDGSPKTGIAKVTIPQEDLETLSPQFLKYSVSAIKASDGSDVLLYADTKFGAVGTIELIGNAMPTFRSEKVYNTFTGEIDFMGNVVYHTSSIPAIFYEAQPATSLSFSVKVTNFIGKVWIEGTANSTISVNSYLHAKPLRPPMVFSTPTTITFIFEDVPVDNFKYFRVLYQGNKPVNPTGTVDTVTVW
jgi:hypothetical protein